MDELEKVDVDLQQTLRLDFFVIYALQNGEKQQQQRDRGTSQKVARSSSGPQKFF
ncbi:hypothetical protein KFK09_000416 [Dendrobium nobile]|uniref:Uncharacterized protein n=1 Tax=Dendrobium nobile TaxID=94219 RepID=A0A8T3C8K7_DENNO|nr:hypothetical protein KFK09_000416 [Dendrobium nobile]